MVEKSSKNSGKTVEKSRGTVQNTVIDSGKNVNNLSKNAEKSHKICVKNVDNSRNTCGNLAKNHHTTYEKHVENYQKLYADEPLISVIIPVYNVASRLEACLDSVCEQTYSNLEIILVDDGSTDQSGEICDNYAKKDVRIKVIHQKNQGLSAARNAALDIFTGEYVTFVDSDDTITPDMIETLDKLYHSKDVKVKICSFLEVFPINSKKYHKKHPKKSAKSYDFSKKWPGDKTVNTMFDTASCLKAMLLEQGFTVSAWGKLYHRELFKNVRYPVGALYEDVGTTYKLIMQSPKIAFTPVVKYYYFQNPQSITKQTFSRDKLSLIKLTDQMCDNIDQAYPELKEVTTERRMHARFSILRQVIFIKHPSQEVKIIEQEMISYLKSHKNHILKNPYATKRDKIALFALLLNKQLFKLGWKIYSR